MKDDTKEMPILCSICGEVAFRVPYEPGRMPPPCSNPDSPAFSDPGEGLAIGDHPDICQSCGAPVSDQYVEDQVNGYLIEESESSYEDAHQYEPEDSLEDDPYWDKEDE